VLGGVTIGDGCVIGANSLVTRDIPPYHLAYGAPARVIRRVAEDEFAPRSMLPACITDILGRCSSFANRPLRVREFVVVVFGCGFVWECVRWVLFSGVRRHGGATSFTEKII